MLKGRGEISDLKEIYIIEIIIFKDEAWAQEMMRFELSSNENSKTLMFEEQGKY